MVGGKCQKCQKNLATTALDIQGWRKWTVCDECCKELQTCNICKEKPATALFKENGWREKQVCGDCKELAEKWERNTPIDDWEKDKRMWDNLDELKRAKAEMEPYLQKSKLVESFGKSQEFNFTIVFGIGKKLSQKETYDASDPYVNEVEQVLGLTDKEKLGAAPGGKALDINFKKEEATRALEVLIKAYDWRINELTNKPLDIPKPDKPEKPNDKGDNPKSDEVCERCQKSCKKLISDDKTKGEKTYQIAFKQITHYYIDFRKEVHYFGTDCSCAEQFKKEHQQTCPRCHKTEWPDMKKGWMLDYEVKQAFCSSLCHVTYRQLKWEEAEKLTKIEMMPPELELSTNEGQNTDWEKEGLKREVLFWREYARELEQRLANNPPTTNEERQQSNYLRRLQQNTSQRAESAYQSRYGNLNEDDPNKGKGMSGGMIALLLIGGIAIIGVIIFFLTRNKNKKSYGRY